MDKAQKKAALKRLRLSNPWHFLALGFGSGLAPLMPGTFGSLAALPILALYPFLDPLWQCFVAAFACGIGVKICAIAARDMKMHDHSAIVWDEIAGMLLTMLWVPLTVSNLFAGFLLFRLFDIVKPWPISYLDKHVHGGVGIMADDIAAGMCACGALHLALFWNLF